MLLMHRVRLSDVLKRRGRRWHQGGSSAVSFQARTKGESGNNRCASSDGTPSRGACIEEYPLYYNPVANLLETATSLTITGFGFDPITSNDVVTFDNGVTALWA